MSYEYRFESFFFRGGDLGRLLTEAVAEAQKDGFEYHDVRFAQSSANGTGISALLVLRKLLA